LQGNPAGVRPATADNADLLSIHFYGKSAAPAGNFAGIPLIDRLADVLHISDFVIRPGVAAAKDAAADRLMELNLNRRRPNLIFLLPVGVQQNATVPVLIEGKLPFEF
jgi:hypothetical protein